MNRSSAAGIPDFRSPSSGLYSKLRGFDLPYPEAIFQLDYFKEHPEPFFAMAKELYPKTFEPTPCHYFLRLLHQKGYNFLLCKVSFSNYFATELVMNKLPSIQDCCLGITPKMCKLN